MDESLYEVTFSGEIQAAARPDEVKAGIARMFTADEVTIARLFSGNRIVINQKLSAETADKYSITFTKSGTIYDLALMPADTVPSEPNVDRAATKSPSPASAAPADRGASNNQRFGKIAALLAICSGKILLGSTIEELGAFAHSEADLWSGQGISDPISHRNRINRNQ